MVRMQSFFRFMLPSLRYAHKLWLFRLGYGIRLMATGHLRLRDSSRFARDSPYDGFSPAHSGGLN